jgi:hypothetical protein
LPAAMPLVFSDRSMLIRNLRISPAASPGGPQR